MADDEEPDYRFTLANERTFLAWTRTGLATLAAAVGLMQLARDVGPQPLRLLAALILAVLALLLSTMSYRRWRQVDRAIRAQQPLPRAWLPAVTAAGLTVTVIVAMVLMILD
jgi:putative membrane protein